MTQDPTYPGRAFVDVATSLVPDSRLMADFAARLYRWHLWARPKRTRPFLTHCRAAKERGLNPKHGGGRAMTRELFAALIAQGVIEVDGKEVTAAAVAAGTAISPGYDCQLHKTYYRINFARVFELMKSIPRVASNAAETWKKHKAQWRSLVKRRATERAARGGGDSRGVLSTLRSMAAQKAVERKAENDEHFHPDGTPKTLAELFAPSSS